MNSLARKVRLILHGVVLAQNVLLVHSPLRLIGESRLADDLSCLVEGVLLATHLFVFSEDESLLSNAPVLTVGGEEINFEIALGVFSQASVSVSLLQVVQRRLDAVLWSVL